MELAKPDPVALLPRFLCAVALLMVLSACASTGEQTGTGRVTADPRPIGVPEDATAEERGREILRVVIALIKHGDLRDTEFASRLFRLPIRRDDGLTLLDSAKFPQQLARGFSYLPKSPAGPAAFVQLDSSSTCVRLEDFFSTFNTELGVGRQVTLFNFHAPPQKFPPEKGWREARPPHRSGIDLFQTMQNGISVSAFVSKETKCVLDIGVRKLELPKP